MDPAARQLIEALHRSSMRCVLAVTGGGTQALAMLLNVPGASRTILEALVPYQERPLIEFLGHRPKSFCSQDTSRAMAQRAYDRAGWLAPGEETLGLGCTASLATDRPKKGPHRFHLAVRTSACLTVHSLNLVKNSRSREAEEAVLDTVLLNALAGACGLADRVDVALLPEESIQTETLADLDPWSLFWRHEISELCVEIDGRQHAGVMKPKLLIPGAFNPLHAGHRGLAAVAARLTGANAAFEMSVTNVDKPALSAGEARRRLSQFTWGSPLWLTRAPTFVEKALLFPATIFAIGADTAARIVDPRYYQASTEVMEGSLQQIREQGCKFLVAGRVDETGAFLQLADLLIPEVFRELFKPIAPSELRLAISSTLLRKS